MACMGDIVNISDFRKPAARPLEEIVKDCTDALLLDWERFARNNRLNEYFVEAASVWTEAGKYYLSDLNAISFIEEKIGLNIVLRAPLTQAHMGWKASFHIKNATVSTPELPFETYARCFNILLFIRLKRELILNGMEAELL